MFSGERGRLIGELCDARVAPAAAFLQESDDYLSWTPNANITGTPPKARRNPAAVLTLTPALTPTITPTRTPNPTRTPIPTPAHTQTLTQNLTLTLTPKARRNPAVVYDAAHSRTLVWGGCDPAHAHGGCSAQLYAHRLDINSWTPLDVAPSTAKPAGRSGASATLSESEGIDTPSLPVQSQANGSPPPQHSTLEAD